MASYEKSNAVISRDRQFIAPCQHAANYPLAIGKARGSIVWDLDGNRYIDFIASASSLNVGSLHPAVRKAIKKQLRRTTQYTAAYTYNKASVDYAEALAAVYPGNADVKVCFGHSGSDSNDAAIKFARAYTQRKNILVFKKGYHGSTYGSGSMTSWRKDVYEKIGPMLPGIIRLPFYESSRYDKSEEELEAEVRAAVDPESIAAVIIEPVQGEGGLTPADPVFIRHLYALCKRNGILFFAEEVQQGFYRTGRFFSIEHYDIVPDGIIIGKSAGAGLVLGAFIGRKEIMDSLPPMAHLLTLAANPLSCSAGLAQLKYLKSNRFQSCLKRNIAMAREIVCSLQRKYPDTISFVHITGMSIGIGVKADGNRAAGERAREIVLSCFKKGLLILPIADNVLRLQPPLNIPVRELKKGFQILEEAIAQQ